LEDLLTYLNVHGVVYLAWAFLAGFALIIIVAFKNHWESEGYSRGFTQGFQEGLEEGNRRWERR
jgi:hypothetical protein